jgi:hypothetical protein
MKLVNKQPAIVVIGADRGMQRILWRWDMSDQLVWDYSETS